MFLESDGELDRDPAHGAGDDLGPHRPPARLASARCCGAPLSPAGRSGRARSRPSPSLRPWTDALQDLVERDFLVREPRSAVRGEDAYRFKHVLIRDVAYAGLSKSSRAALHLQMARWLAGRTAGDELVEIRAHHLQDTVQLEEELEGRVSPELAAEAAAALEQAGRQGVRPRGECRRPEALRPGRGARRDARAPLPGGPRGLAADGLPDRLDRDARGQRSGARRG